MHAADMKSAIAQSYAQRGRMLDAKRMKVLQQRHEEQAA